MVKIEVPITEGADTVSRPLPDIAELKQSVAGAQGILGSLFARWRTQRVRVPTVSVPSGRARRGAQRLDPVTASRADGLVDELLAIHLRVRSEQPGLDRFDLYREILLEKLGGEHGAAFRIMRRAEETFTQWPVERELSLCDVASQFLASPEAGLGDDHGYTPQDFARHVALRIPDGA